MSRSYWRSLEQIEGSPGSREFLEREFPEGASELPEGVSRREMMLLLGASASLAGLAACRRPVERIVPFANPPEEIIPGVPRRYATTMPFGRSAYGLLVESHEGRPTKIEGNALHPSTLGASSLRVQASILDLYDPDRSRKVLHRGESKSWADFVAAWGETAKTHAAGQGEGLAVLSGSFASPTLARLRRSLEDRFPRMRWATWEAVDDENARAGVATGTGRDLETVLRIERAAVILALDADLFLTDPEGIVNARGFAAGRRAGTEGGTMNRLYSVEGAYSLTGAMADHRLRLASRDVAAFVAALAAELMSSGLPVDAPGTAPAGEIDQRWLHAVAQDLMANRERGLIVAGPRQPPAVHAAVLALNVALGNVGQTIAYHERKDAAPSSRSSLADLVTAMKAGTVTTLAILGANPVYDAPADLDFASALGKVANTIALSSHVDETSRLAAWHLPRAHFLEAWGDARAIDGTLAVIQPLILPLYLGRSDIEILSLLASDQEQPGYDLVRQSWKGILGDAAFEDKWGRVLHDGVLPGSELPEVVPTVVGRPLAGLAPSSSSAGDLEIVFEPGATVHDGRFANDGWLQELPDPLTKITWDNPVLLSPATAARVGAKNEDLVRVEIRGRALDLPVWIVPGQADGTVVVTLGYGRTSAGRVGNGVGFDTYRLRTLAAPDFDTGVRLTPTGETYLLGTTQEHGSMEGRPIVREAALEEYRQSPGFAKEAVHAVPPAPLWNERGYETGPQWGMAIDLNTCVGCNACVVACQSENNIPIVGKAQVRKGREMHWLRVDRYFAEDGEDRAADPQVVFQPVPCMHCENAPCEQVCPVAATVHSPEGLNDMVYNRCIGTRYCSNNCPYKVRRFNFFNFTKDTPESMKLLQNPDVTVRSRGVMEKCTYCVQRINSAKIDARLAGREVGDGDIETACQQACPAGAIVFGDVSDPGSRVSKLKADPRNYSMLEELHTRPRTTYLAKVRNPHPDLLGGRA